MKPIILFDTDMDTDCDDAGALAIIYTTAKTREKSSTARYAAALTNSSDIYTSTAPTCSTRL